MLKANNKQKVGDQKVQVGCILKYGLKDAGQFPLGIYRALLTWREGRKKRSWRTQSTALISYLWLLSHVSVSDTVSLSACKMPRNMMGLISNYLALQPYRRKYRRCVSSFEVPS